MAEPTDLDKLGVSEGLQAFVDQFPYERRSILAFVRHVADSLPPGTCILDVGAGDAPYRELFGHCEYLTTDWEGSAHKGALEVDFVAQADALPLDDSAVDAALLTQMLEHVPDPAAVLGEVARVVRSGGGIFLTVPFVWELHELPFDFWRFTPGSLERLLAHAGFTDVHIEPRNDCFSTIAQLLLNLGGVMGHASDGRDSERDAAAELLGELAERIAALAALDATRTLPLGWSATARRV